MVIRSLVPGGSAERHGGLLPGDQLVSVNHSQLDLLTLAQSVEVLKSIPSGTVRLGIRKPLVVSLDLLVLCSNCTLKPSSGGRSSGSGLDQPSSCECRSINGKCHCLVLGPYHVVFGFHRSRCSSCTKSKPCSSGSWSPSLKPSSLKSRPSSLGCSYSSLSFRPCTVQTF